MAQKLGSASSSSNKRMKKMGIDRLSALPDCLLISILSLLRTREAVRTSVLSRRWQFLWTDLPALAFQEESHDNNKISRFVAGVRKYLAICCGNHLQRFEVSFKYDKGFASDVNTCVQFALKHKVEDLALLLNDWSPVYLLPEMLYSNRYLTCLRLQGCIMATKNDIEWGALTSLYLGRVEFCQNVIENIMHCPVLYDLTLSYCSQSTGLDCLHVKSQSLRQLTMIGWDPADYDVESEISMVISAPFINYLRISVYVEGRRFKLRNLKSLLEADIDFDGYESDALNLIAYTRRLFKSVRHVKELKVGSECILALGDLVVEEGMQLSQSGVECLKLCCMIYNENTIDGIICLLESSPKLKQLFISLWCNISQDDSEEVELNRDLLHLKTVTITVHEQPELIAKPLLTVVQLLLKKAPVLEKLVIDFSFPSSESYPPLEYWKIAQTLLSYPKASTKAVVELVPPSYVQLLTTRVDDLIRKLTEMLGDIDAMWNDKQAFLQHITEIHGDLVALRNAVQSR